MIELCGRRYENGEPVRVLVAGERIAAVLPAWPRDPEAVRDWPWIAPGFCDLQINGHGGTWFGRVGQTPDEVLRALEPHFRFGVTRLCPTLVTNSFEALADGFAAIRKALEQEPWAAQLAPGIHLEGPYLSPEDGPRGAHPLEHIRPPDWAEFARWQEISGNRIRLVTVAPESDGALDFIRRAVASGVVVSIGHTAALPERIREAVDAGATLSTHLGNGAHATIRRHPNYIWEQLGEPRLTACLITDGHHLPASVVRSMVKVKTPRRTIVTCDAAGLAGCPPGTYTEGIGAVEILEDGRIVVAGQRQILAGSGQSTETCVANVVTMAGVTLQEACDMAGRNPARALRFEDVRLKQGSRADLVLFRWQGPGDRIAVEATVASGTLRFGAIPEPARCA